MPILAVLTSATAEPITVEEVKAQLRVQSTNEDELIGGYISVARAECEHLTGRAMLPTQYRLVHEDFPGLTGIIELPVAPLLSSTGSTVASSTSISVMFYRDTTIVNDSTYVDSTVFAVDNIRTPGAIYPIYENEWPSCVTDYKKDAVQITFWAGYPSRDKIPENLKLWMKMKVGSMYENREPIFEGNQQEMPHQFYDGLLDKYIVVTK